MTDVYIERGSKRVFACAFDWPGWCRSGKDETAALQALESCGPRYALIAKQARVPFDLSAATKFTVAERLPGSMTTDFGAPGAIPKRDSKPLTGKAAAHEASLLEASWDVFERVASMAPASLRKGPRGGGRDRDTIVGHVTDAEDAYARKIGLRVKDVAERRRAILDAIRGGGTVEAPAKGWPLAYAARRIAWHVIDHTWEIEDRSH